MRGPVVRALRNGQRDPPLRGHLREAEAPGREGRLVELGALDAELLQPCLARIPRRPGAAQIAGSEPRSRSNRRQ